MEQVAGNPDRVFGKEHSHAGSGGASTGAAAQVSDACTAFLDYPSHGTVNEMAIGVDGVVHVHQASPGAGRDRWPFDAPPYLLPSIAIGGVLGGTWTTPFSR